MRTALIASLAAALAFAGCNTGDSGDDLIENPSSADSIKISPASVWIASGDSRQFYAKPGNSEVSWEIKGKLSSDTKINGGLLYVAEGETAAAFTVVAKLIADQAKTDTAAVTIMPSETAESFSNAESAGGSAIDLIKAAATENLNLALIRLTSGTKSVKLGDGDTDIKDGLVLTATGDDPTSPATVIIDGKGGMVTMTGAGQGSVITVGEGVTLTLRNITFVGLTDTQNDATTNNNAALFRVKDGGHLVLEDGAKITGNTHIGNAVGYSGGGFSEEEYEGSGGGVIVHDGGHLTMTGTSEISGNFANRGGGVLIYGVNSKITMTGGTISGNNANTGGGIFLVDNSVLDMSGNAAIDSNKASGNGGGALIYNSSFTMTGNAAISNNTTQESNGGGLYIANDSAFDMSGNANISGNTANGSGGGVNSSGGTFNMSENARINGNTASSGGGVMVNGEMVFTMEGGEISGNQATAGNGGGVYVASNSTFTMNSGIIYGNNAGAAGLKNTATGEGAAAFVAGSASNVKSSNNEISKP
jgi:hypothetical protein